MFICWWRWIFCVHWHPIKQWCQPQIYGWSCIKYNWRTFLSVQTHIKSPAEIKEIITLNRHNTNEPNNRWIREYVCKERNTNLDPLPTQSWILLQSGSCLHQRSDMKPDPHYEPSDPALSCTAKETLLKWTFFPRPKGNFCYKLTFESCKHMTMNTSVPLTVSCVPFYAQLFVLLVSSLTSPDCVAESTTTDTS